MTAALRRKTNIRRSMPPYAEVEEQPFLEKKLCCVKVIVYCVRVWGDLQQINSQNCVLIIVKRRTETCPTK